MEEQGKVLQFGDSQVCTVLYQINIIHEASLQQLVGMLDE
jgi:hypothetical protein